MTMAFMAKELQGSRSARRSPRTCVPFEYRPGLLLGFQNRRFGIISISLPPMSFAHSERGSGLQPWHVM